MTSRAEFIELNKNIHDRNTFDCGENSQNFFHKKPSIQTYASRNKQNYDFPRYCLAGKQKI